MIDRLVDRLPKAPDRWIAVLVLLVILYFARERWVEAALGALAGGLLVWIWSVPRDAR